MWGRRLAPFGWRVTFCGFSKAGGKGVLLFGLLSFWGPKTYARWLTFSLAVVYQYGKQIWSHSRASEGVTFTPGRYGGGIPRSKRVSAETQQSLEARPFGVERNTKDTCTRQGAVQVSSGVLAKIRARNFDSCRSDKHSTEKRPERARPLQMYERDLTRSSFFKNMVHLRFPLGD